MKIVLNKAFGGFSVPQAVCDELGCTRYGWNYAGDEMDLRREPALVEWAETHDSALKVVDIPDTATDWELSDYDGMESIIYVVGGKLFHL